jgi:hypothetical protein
LRVARVSASPGTAAPQMSSSGSARGSISPRAHVPRLGQPPSSCGPGSRARSAAIRDLPRSTRPLTHHAHPPTRDASALRSTLPTCAIPAQAGIQVRLRLCGVTACAPTQSHPHAAAGSTPILAVLRDPRFCLLLVFPTHVGRSGRGRYQKQRGCGACRPTLYERTAGRQSPAILTGGEPAYADRWQQTRHGFADVSCPFVAPAPPQVPSSHPQPTRDWSGMAQAYVRASMRG